jgi:hypothetical protein
MSGNINIYLSQKNPYFNRPVHVHLFLFSIRLKNAAQLSLLSGITSLTQRLEIEQNQSGSSRQLVTLMHQLEAPNPSDNITRQMNRRFYPKLDLAYSEANFA